MNLDLNADGNEYKLRLPEFCGGVNYPMVFVAGEYVGNLSETKALVKANSDMKKYIEKKMENKETRARDVKETLPKDD